MKSYQLFIDGAFTDPSSGQWFDSVNPYTGEVWARIPRADANDVERAVLAAERAMREGEWSRMTATQRGHALRRLGDVVAQHAERLATIEVRDNGKLFAEMSNQCRYLAQWFHYYGGLADKVQGTVPPIDKPDVLNFARYEPIGVTACITPWNSPLLLMAWKVAPALAAGNAVVIKPSEYTSASTLEFAELTIEAGLPAGLVNVVTGYGAEVGEALVSHRLVRKVAFTGGESGGRHVNVAAAAGFKHVTLELGGKSANIVFADARMDDAVSGAISGIFAASGQTCIAGSRLLLQYVDPRRLRAASDRNGVQPRGSAIPMSPRYPARPDVPPRRSIDKVIDYIEIAKNEGARCVLGGGPADPPPVRRGLFVRADDLRRRAQPDMRIAQEEVFGPVLCVIRSNDDDEAVRIANDTHYGLAAGVWTESLRRAVDMSNRLAAGTVWVNTYRSTSLHRSRSVASRPRVWDGRTASTRFANTCRPRACGSTQEARLPIPTSAVEAKVREVIETLTVAQAFARALSLAGVKRIFGVPGGGSSLDLIDAAVARGIDFVLTKTENAAIMMAGASAEATGVLGVALVTKGPGVANGANGVAYASLDRVPVLVVSDGFTPAQLAYVTHQVFDQKAMLAPVIKGHGRLDGPDAVDEIDRLIELACTPPRGPIHVEFTRAAARRTVEIDAARQSSAAPSAKAVDRLGDALAGLEQVRERIAAAQRPVLVLGLEARWHAAEVRRLAATLACPVLCTYKAKGVVPDTDSQLVGLFTGGSQEAACIAGSDLMVLVGLDPVELIVQPWPYGKPAVEVAAAAHPVHYVEPAAVAVGPLGAMVDWLAQRLRDGPHGWSPEEIAQLRTDTLASIAYGAVTRGVAPDRVVQLAAAACAERALSARVTVDAGAHMFSATAYFPSTRPGDLLISNGLATMAFALPAAIAVALEDPSQPVICFTGDGGLMMALGELCTAVENNANVVVVVFNDSALSLIDIKQQARALPTHGVRWQRHDFAGTMRALGGIGLSATDEAQYADAMRTALESRGPCLIDVLIDPGGYRSLGGGSSRQCG